MEEPSMCSSRSAQGASPSPAAKSCTAQARIWVVFSPAGGARRAMRDSSSSGSAGRFIQCQTVGLGTVASLCLWSPVRGQGAINSFALSVCKGLRAAVLGTGRRCGWHVIEVTLYQKAGSPLG